MTDWLPEHHEALKQHIEMGMSALRAAIALNDSFGTAYSRNAVISKAARAGIRLTGGHGGRRGPKGGPSQRKVRAKAVTTAQRPDVAIRKAVSGLKLVLTPFVPRPDPRPGAVALLDLAPDGCRWPSGEGPYLFCNEPREFGVSYCGPHCCLAYRAPEQRRVPS